MKMLKMFVSLGVWGSLAVVVAMGATHRVPQDYTTIQDAMDASMDGDTILVDPGVYGGGNQLTGKNLLIMSTEGASQTIIDGNGGSRGFWFGDLVTEATVLDGFTMVNCFGGGGGGGIECWEASPVIRNCIIENCESSWDAGGINLYRSTSHIENCIIRNNVALADWDNAYGGGVCGWSSAPVLINCLISGNRVEGIPYPHATHGYGGGVFFDNFEQADEPVLLNCTIVDNEAVEGDYGGILASCDPYITNCICLNNTPGSYNGGTDNITYSDFPMTLTGDGNINADPLFISDGNFEYLLSQTAAGQSANSPCVDSGSALASEICFGAEVAEVCLDALTTRMDLITDAGIVDMGFHYKGDGMATPTPTSGPSPTVTPSPTMMPTATPTPMDGVSITILCPDGPVTAGTPFNLTARVEVVGEEPLLNIPLFCILDVAGTFFYYPGWTLEPDWEVQSAVPFGVSYKTLIPVCSWPDNIDAGSASFYAAFTDQQITRILGNYDVCTFYWY